LTKLEVKVGGVVFKNPIVASAGEPTTDLEHMKKAMEAGAGGVVAKSICFSPELAKSYDHARWAVINENRDLCTKGKYPKLYAFYGRGGIPLEPKGWMEELKRAQEMSEKYHTVLIGSVGTGPVEQMAEAAYRMEKVGIRIIELDAGCPQTGQLQYDHKLDLVTSADIAKYQTESVVKAVSIPVIYKVAADDLDKMATCKAVKSAGAVAVTVMNRYPGFLVDIETGRPVINSWAGVGGPWMLPLSLRWVSRVHQADPGLSILGTNGCSDYQDALQFIMSGATMACFCTELMLRGYRVITEAVRGIEEFLERKGYGSVQEIIGLAVRNAKTYEELYEMQQVAEINMDSCKKCGLCENFCFYEALTMVEGSPVINKKCKGCGLCLTACPSSAISLKDK